LKLTFKHYKLLSSFCESLLISTVNYIKINIIANEFKQFSP
jgi:hypothetical protein